MTTILTIEKLAEISAISNALANQVEILMPFVEFSEVAHLKEDLLGESLYDLLVTEIEQGTLSGYNKTLVETYLYNYSAWISYFEASPFILYRSSAKGVTKMYSDNSQSLDKEEFANFRQAILDKAIYWKNASIKYMQNNSIEFPLWRSTYFGGTSSTDCNKGYTGQDFSGGIYV